MRNLWVFGCSFSSEHLNIQVQDTYGFRVAKELKLNFMYYGVPGNSNIRMLRDFSKQSTNIQEEDIVIFQHTTYDRLTFQLSPEQYLQTAGLPQLGVDVKKNEPVFRKFSKKELEILHDFLVIWQPYLSGILFETIYNFLSYVKETKNIKLINTYLLPQKKNFKIDETTLMLPVKNKHDNIDLIEFLTNNRLTVGDENNKNNDFHPDINGHKELANKILDKLKNTYNII